jgi:hypothetical protein
MDDTPRTRNHPSIRRGGAARCLLCTARLAGEGTDSHLGIPECELQYCLVAGGGTLVTTINRPTGNLSVKYWIRYACKLATENNTALLFSRDTVEQAALAAKTRQQ